MKKDLDHILSSMTYAYFLFKIDKHALKKDFILPKKEKDIIYNYFKDGKITYKEKNLYFKKLITKDVELSNESGSFLVNNLALKDEACKSRTF